MSVVEVVSSEEDSPLVEGPGRQLRKARESLQLELSAVAAQLHLAESKLRALEEDDFEHLPGPVYVQGYLRNYAALLGIPAEDVLQAYRKLVPTEQSSPKPPAGSIRREVSSNHGGIRLATWGIVVVLISLPLLWWRGYLQESEQRVVTGAESLLTEITEGGEGEQQDLPSQAAAMTTVLPMAEVQSRSWETQTDSGNRSGQPDRLKTTPAGAEPGSAGMTAPVTESRIAIELQGTSWVEVYDASGATQISKLLHAGTRRQIHGTPPFRLVVGNTPAVTLTVDGEKFDLEPYSRQNVAKFTLDPDAVAAP